MFATAAGYLQAKNGCADSLENRSGGRTFGRFISANKQGGCTAADESLLSIRRS
jgi:hypothetical protein